MSQISELEHDTVEDGALKGPTGLAVTIRETVMTAKEAVVEGVRDGRRQLKKRMNKLQKRKVDAPWLSVDNDCIFEMLD